LVDGAIVNKPAYQNCLACHNTTKELQVDGISPRLAEGVGCESCHGPSELWRDSHYQGSFSVSESIEKRGLVNSKSEIVRAKTCTLCHVGGPDRDMNHDIIAAGHPALYFDYGTYLKAYPKHWRENAADPVKQSLERWLIGQVAYQCTSCHQNITGKTLIQLQDPSQNPQRSSIGQASVRMWNLEGLQTTDSLFGFDRKSTDELIQSLETAGSRRGDAEADRKPILEMIQKKRADLLGDPGSYSLEDLQQRLVHWPLEQQRTLVRRKWQAASESLNWEQAALAYLALQSSLPAPDDKKPLDRMRTRLIFPESTQSPGFLLPNSPSEAQAELQSHSWKSDSSLILESLGP